MHDRQFPAVNIRSKNELAKQISNYKLPYKSALALINEVFEDYDKLWSDHPTMSQPKKGKWVRNSKGTKLGVLLKLIDKKVLKPHDSRVPSFIFGGISGLNHKAAVRHLLGRKRKRVMLKLDISKFLEQISRDRVRDFYLHKTGCSAEGAKILADLSCVPYGPKEQPEPYKTIARGFPTSPRLAVWCNLNTFLKLERIIRRELKGMEPRIAVYVDDIAITASGATYEDMMRIFPLIREVLESGDRNQRLPLNEKKTKIIYHSGDTFSIDGEYQGKWSFEHLGLQMNRNSLELGTKTRWKLSKLTHTLTESHGTDKVVRKKRKSALQYKKYIRK